MQRTPFLLGIVVGAIPVNLVLKAEAVRQTAMSKLFKGKFYEYYGLVPRDVSSDT